MSVWRGTGYVRASFSALFWLTFRLGGSGSGKTTLLNQIAYRSTGLPVEDGEVIYRPAKHGQRSSIGGEGTDAVAEITGDKAKSGKRDMGRRIGFVRQQDFLVEHLTGEHSSNQADRSVRETLTYAARLRLPPALSSATIAHIVEQVIDELGLRDASDTVVGGPLRKGISGGEKRCGPA
jgi:ABC-type multidrug transport system ATPase subunit